MDELRSTIEQLNAILAAKDVEIADLKRGRGQISDVLLYAFPVSEAVLTKNQTVAEYLQRLYRTFNLLNLQILFGIIDRP